MPYGLLIAFEGMPGAPTRRHLDVFSMYLHSRSILHKSFHFLDTSTPLGSLAFVAHTDMFSNFNAKTTHLLMDAERWSKIDDINRTLQSGIHVLVDRFTLCSIAESLADLPQATQIEEFPNPDIVFYFQHSAEESVLSFPYSHIASLEKLRRIKTCYEHAIEFYPCFKDSLFMLPPEFHFSESILQDKIKRKFHSLILNDTVSIHKGDHLHSDEEEIHIC